MNPQGSAPRPVPARYHAWMDRAIEVAGRTRESVDVPVGAVLYDPAGEEVATGWNQREAAADPTAHAEIVALRAAARARNARRLDGYTLVVTLEPSNRSPYSSRSVS